MIYASPRTPRIARNPAARAGLVVAVAAACAAAPANADQYNMGAGIWDCGKVISVANGENQSEIGQLVGWILGFWSYATHVNDDAFVDTVEEVGGRSIVDITLARCDEADPETRLHVVAYSMVVNTE